jgi:hypothetical protein
MSNTESTTLPSLPESYRSLKQGKAAKAGARSQGYVHYRLLTDLEHRQLYITLIANDSSGGFSREIVPFERIESAVQGLVAGQPIPSKCFQSCFISKSQNNAGFLAAVLRNENLLQAVPVAAHQHALAGDWPRWKTALLASADGAEIYQPEPPKPRAGSLNKPLPAEAASMAEPAAGQAAAASAIDKAEQVDAETELSEAEMDLLQPRDPEAITDQSDDALTDGDSDNVVDNRHGKKPRRDKPEHPSRRGRP